MKAELKQKWLEALRSGEYQQGTGTLKEGNNPARYCCLGLLREVAGLEWEHIGGNQYRPLDPHMADGGYLHPEECKLLGIDNGLARDLAARNDGHYDRADVTRYEKHTFPELAEIIEREVAVTGDAT